MRIFVIGDIHGAYKALKQCLERSGFRDNEDRLICLGDVCDGWPETKECIDELLRINALVYLRGNHDEWTLSWMETQVAETVWYLQGGQATIASYKGNVPESHKAFLKNALPYYLYENKLFVHAGFDLKKKPEDQDNDTLFWSRELAIQCLDALAKNSTAHFSNYDEIYIGHTPVHGGKPLRSGEVWMMDTGAGWSGVLSMMDISTKALFQSDPVPGLYPGIEGRKRY